MNRLFSKLVSIAIIAALLTYAVPTMMPTVKAQPSAPSYYITPATESFTTSAPPPGSKFTVTVMAAAVNGTDSWSVDVGFNSTQLSIVSVTFVSTNATAGGLWPGHSTTPLGPIIGPSDVLASETLLGQDYLNGAATGAVMTITFQIILTPGPGQTLTSLIDPGFGLPPVGETLFILQSPSTDFPTGEIDNPNTAPCTYSFSSVVTPPTKSQITFAQTGLDGSASGTVVTINGTALTYSQLPNVTSVDSSDTLIFSYQTDVSSTTAGEQFVSTGVNATSPLTVSTSETITGSYKTQYQVSFAVNPSGAGTTTPSGTNVWEDSGPLPISATPNSGYAFSNWTTSTGSITVTSTKSASTTANISGPGTITANFVLGTGGNPLYDIIGDGKTDIVDIKDIHAAASAFGSRPDLPNWNPRADVNGDGKIDIVDIYMIAAHFGQLD